MSEDTLHTPAWAISRSDQFSGKFGDMLGNAPEMFAEHGAGIVIKVFLTEPDIHPDEQNPAIIEASLEKWSCTCDNCGSFQGEEIALAEAERIIDARWKLAVVVKACEACWKLP